MKKEISVGATVRFKDVPNYIQVTKENGNVIRYGYWDIEGEDGPVGATYWYINFPKLGELKVDSNFIELVAGGRTWIAEKREPTDNGKFLVTPAHWEN